MSKNLQTITVLFLLLFAPLLSGETNFNSEPYQTENTALIDEKVFYPAYIRDHDPVTFANVFKEFRNRYEFFLGIAPESKQSACFKMQERVNKWLKTFQKRKDNFPFKWADNELLFNENSPLFNMIRPAPHQVDDDCLFFSYGNIASAGGVFCRYHGPDPGSEFYQAHKHRFNEARPFITAYDVTEILIFLPFLMIIPISWLMMRKFLSVKP